MSVKPSATSLACSRTANRAAASPASRARAGESRSPCCRPRSASHSSRPRSAASRTARPRAVGPTSSGAEWNDAVPSCSRPTQTIVSSPVAFISSARNPRTPRPSASPIRSPRPARRSPPPVAVTATARAALARPPSAPHAAPDRVRPTQAQRPSTIPAPERRGVTSRRSSSPRGTLAQERRERGQQRPLRACHRLLQRLPRSLHGRPPGKPFSSATTPPSRLSRRCRDGAALRAPPPAVAG